MASEQSSPVGFTSPHRAVHPFGRVPVLDHDGFRLYETQAMVRYLDRLLPQHPLTPTNPQQNAIAASSEFSADRYERVAPHPPSKSR